MAVKIKLYYVSKNAQRKHLYKEGSTVTIVQPYLVTQYSPKFWCVNLDSTGTNYVQGEVILER